MLIRQIQNGVTLIEILVVLAIIAVLLGLGLPSINEYLANAKIRNAATELYSSLQFARAEAIRRNGGVELVLTGDAPVVANVDAPNVTTDGPNWLVRSLNWGATSTYTLLEGRSVSESSQRSGTATSVGLSSSSGIPGIVRFSGFGATSPSGVTAEFNFANSSGGACVAGGGPMRCLRVQVSPGGQVRLCDPAVTDNTDARACVVM